MDTIGQSHDLRLHEVRERITSEITEIEEKKKEVQCLHELTENEKSSSLLADYIQANRELHEQQKNTHPGFLIAFDNIDFHLSRRNMTMKHQNRDVHWINHIMVENRVSGNNLSSECSQKDVLDIPNIQFFPSVEDQRKQRLNYIVIVSRILVDHFDAFSAFKNVCVRHIPHK